MNLPHQSISCNHVGPLGAVLASSSVSVPGWQEGGAWHESALRRRGLVCPFPEPGRGCAHSILSGAHLSSSARDHLQMRRPQLRRPILLPGVTVVSALRDQDLHPPPYPGLLAQPPPLEWAWVLLLYSQGQSSALLIRPSRDFLSLSGPSLVVFPEGQGLAFRCCVFSG